MMVRFIEFYLPVGWLLLFFAIFAAFLVIFVVIDAISRYDTRRPIEPLECDQKIRALRLKQRFSANSLPTQIDAIVIGSGIGGLVTAATLAKSGRKVVVLEQHDQAGGCCHTFVDHGYEWDVGIHCIGKMGQKDFERYLLDQLTDGQLEWQRLNEDFDNVVIVRPQPDEMTTIPIWADRQRLLDELTQRYPEHGEALRKFFAYLRSNLWGLPVYLMFKILPLWLANFFIKTGIYKKVTNYDAAFHQRTLTNVLDQFFGEGDDEVKLVLSYLCCEYLVEPARSSSGLLALVHNHFTGGAYFPIGGGSEIAYTMIHVIERAGGRVFVNANVTEIMVANGNKAIGVRVGTNLGPVEIKAPIVISAAGISNTFQRLLPKTVAMTTKLGQLLESGCTHPSLALFQVFVGLKGDSKKDFELPAKNLLFFNETNIDEAFSNWNNLDLDEATGDEAKIPFLYVSFPSAKDPTYNERYPGRSAGSLITTAPMKWFQRWERGLVKKRGEDYEALKMRLARRCWDLVTQKYPKLSDRLDFIDAGSGLTAAYYLNAICGEAYGLEHDSTRFLPEIVTTLRPKVPEIENLYLTGQDVVTCGFVPALFSGLLTSLAVLPCSESAKLITGLVGGYLRHLATSKVTCQKGREVSSCL